MDTQSSNVGPGSRFTIDGTNNWPKDAIGNDLRKGALVTFRIPESVAILRVADVVKAGTMHDAEGKPMKLQGTVTFVLQVPYNEGGTIGQALVLKEPEQK